MATYYVVEGYFDGLIKVTEWVDIAIKTALEYSGLYSGEEFVNAKRYVESKFEFGRYASIGEFSDGPASISLINTGDNLEKDFPIRREVGRLEPNTSVRYLREDEWAVGFLVARSPGGLFVVSYGDEVDLVPARYVRGAN